jgi:cephalosporin hydroxylase
MNLYSRFLNHQGRRMIKNAHYFPIYERHFAPYINRPVLMFEIGTGMGGSALMWKEYFGPLARIVTIDIADKSDLAETQIFPRRGSQSDAEFLQALVAEFGAPDIVLDDGSHHMPDVNKTFDVMFPLLTRDGVYLVEDLNSAYWPDFGGGLRSEGSFVERCKQLVDELNAHHVGADLSPTEFTRSAFSISFYDSLIVIEKTPFRNIDLLYLPEQV